jgi:hypothetical protein
VYYILIDDSGIEVTETNKMLSIEKMQRLVGIPGVSTLIEVLWYDVYSDPDIKMIVDENFLYDVEDEDYPTCFTSEGEPIYGQVLIVAIDPENRENFILLNEEQVEVVKKETVFCSYYALISAKGVEIVASTKMLSRQEIEHLVGVPGEKTSADIVEYHNYSDSKIRMIVDDKFEYNQKCYPTCKTSDGYQIDGQVLVLALDDRNSEGLGLLTKTQAEIVKEETILYRGYDQYRIPVKQ